MTQEWLLIFAGAITLSAIGFVCVAVLWLRKLRETVATALAEAAGQQVRTNQRLNEAIAQVQKQQDGYARQVQILAEAGIRLQQEISSVANRIENSHGDHPRGAQTLH
jgi:DNA anti-recombination protein RmuC